MSETASARGTPSPVIAHGDRPAAVVLIVVALILAGTVPAVISQQRRAEREAFKQKLNHAIALHRAGSWPFIDLAVVFSFPWDTVRVFGPYTPLERIDAALGAPWPRWYGTSIESSDGIVLLVFTAKGEIVQFLEYPRGPGCDLAFVEGTDGIDRSAARFVVDQKDRRVRWQE